MPDKLKLSFVTVIPSPYQRDLFGALAEREDVDLDVYYMGASLPESPWPEKPLRPFEQIMQGTWLPVSGARAHANWPLPDFSKSDVTILSTYSSFTGQWLMRSRLSGRRWLFWGERMRSQPPGWRRSVQRVLTSPLARASGIVGMGQAAMRDYRRRYPHLPHFCVPYYCNLKDFLCLPRPVRQGQAIRFLFCGQMILRKGVDVLLLAFDRLVKSNANVELTLVGREAELPLFMSSISEKARSLIRYEGFHAPEKLPDFFSRCDVFVLPSRHDGWGVVVNQALGAGLPVIASEAVGAAIDLVEPNVNGLRCIPGDVDSLHRAMEQIVMRPELALEWGKASRRKAMTLTPEVGAEQLVSICRTTAAPFQPGEQSRIQP